MHRRGPDRGCFLLVHPWPWPRGYLLLNIPEHGAPGRPEFPITHASPGWRLPPFRVPDGYPEGLRTRRLRQEAALLAETGTALSVALHRSRMSGWSRRRRRRRIALQRRSARSAPTAGRQLSLPLSAMRRSNARPSRPPDPPSGPLRVSPIVSARRWVQWAATASLLRALVRARSIRHRWCVFERPAICEEPQCRS